MRTAVVVAFVLTAAHGALAQSACRVEGVWRLISPYPNAPPPPSGYRSMKIFTKEHFVFVGEEPGRIKEPKTAADSLAALLKTESGGGTYTANGSTYTEKYDFFWNPEYVGTSIRWSCRTEGDKLYQSGAFPIYQAGRKVREMRVQEIWRRIE